MSDAGAMALLYLVTMALIPDCLCGHVRADHHFSLFDPGVPCFKRVGWRRRRCLCRDYETRILEHA